MAVRSGVRLLLTIRAGVVLLLFLLLASGVPAMAEAEDPGTEAGFETLAPSAHPFMRGLRQAPPETRLWAQFSDSQGFFTTSEEQLPGPYTPTDPTQGAALVLDAFGALDVIETTSSRLYHVSPAVALWDSGFADLPLRVSWQVSASGRDLEEVHAAAPRLEFSTRVVVERDGEIVIIGQGRTTVDLVAMRGQTTRVEIGLGRALADIHAGDRLQVELDWRWFDSLDGRPLVRPPLVSVHPGSWLDLPILEPLRILHFAERHVLDEVYVRAEAAHLFAVHNIDLEATSLAIHGPRANAVVGKALVRPLEPEKDVAHRASFDWVLPIYDLAQDGDHSVWMTVRQVNDPAPRLAASRTLVLDDMSVDAPAPDGSAGAFLLLFTIVPAALVSLSFVHRRRA